MSAEIASLSFSVDSSPLAQASTRLDQLGQSAQSASTKSSQLLSAADALVAALNRNTAAADALTAKLEQVQQSGIKTSQAIQQVGATAGAATSNVVQLGNATAQARAGFDTAAAAAQRLRAAWAELGNQGAATLRNMEQMQRLAQSSANQPNPGWRNIGALGAAQSYAVSPVGRLSNLSSDGSMPGMRPAANQNTHGGSDEYRNMMLQNILFQGKDFFEQTITGGSPVRAALTQAPQVAALMQMGNLGPRDVVSGLGNMAKELGTTALSAVQGLSGVTLAFGALTTVLATAAAALSSYKDQQKELQLSVAGRGRASGATVGDINRAALAGAGPANVSVPEARDLIGDYAQTGAIGTQMYSGLLKVAKDYAETTRQELPDANKALAAAFADPAKGAEMLAGQLANLNAEQVENIQRMAASGDRLGAQKALLDSLGGSLVSATDRLGFFARQWEQFKNTTSGEFDAIGRVVDRVLTGGDLEQQIETARSVLSNSQARQNYLPFGIGQSDTDKAQAQLDALLAKQKQLQDNNRTADLNNRSRAVDAIVKAANPADEQLKRTEDSAKRIRTELAAGALDPDGSSLRTAQGLEASARRIREDLAAGGTELAASLRRAGFEASQVGRSQVSQSSANIEFEIAERQKQIEAQNLNPNERNAQLQSLEMERVTRLQTLQRQTVYNSSNGSGSYAIGLGQAPAQYRDLYYNAAQQYGINPDMLVSMGKQESGFNPNARSRVGAEGIAQFMPATRRGLGDFDPYDPSQAIPKQAELVRQLLDRYNGNETAALVGYNAGPRVADRFVKSGFDASVLPDETKGYLKAIQTSSPNAQSSVAAANDRNRQLEDEAAKVKISAQYLGQNNVAYETQIKYQQLLSDAMARNVPITDEFKASLMKVAEAGAQANRSLTNIRAANDIRMGDEQLGRDRYGQQAYSSAAGLYGDTSSAEAQTYISRKRDQLEVQDAKGTLQDTATGFVQALSKGTNAASAFANALSRIGDKLISGALDSLFSSAFKGLGSGGGLGGLLGGLLPSGGLFANGGIMTAKGPVQLRTYANGGVANSPQLAIYGEGSSPEAYVPLPDGKRIPVAMQTPANGNAPVAGMGNATQFNVYAPGSTMTPAEFEGIARRAVAENNAQQRLTQFSRGVADKKAFG